MSVELNRSPVQQVASIADVRPGASHRNHAGVSVGHFQTDSFDELSESSFAERTVCIQMRPLSASIWTNGKHRFEGLLGRGAWQAHTPGDSFRGVTADGYELLRLGLPETALQSALDGLETGRRLASVELIDPDAAVDPWLLSSAQQISAALFGGVEGSRLYVDSLLAAIVFHLVFNHSNLVPNASISRRSRRGGLAPTQLKKLTRYLDDHLAREVRLDELAALCNLSSHHLCRAFRQSTGLPPHRWQINRRVERARELLERTDRTVGDIAAAVGYDDPGHFAATFRRWVGTSPLRYRREH